MTPQSIVLAKKCTPPKKASIYFLELAWEPQNVDFTMGSRTFWLAKKIIENKM